MISADLRGLQKSNTANLLLSVFVSYVVHCCVYVVSGVSKRNMNTRRRPPSDKKSSVAKRRNLNRQRSKKSFPGLAAR